MDDEKCFTIDIVFSGPKPTFGDLLQLCGCDSDLLPPSGAFRFGAFADLQVEQIDDYFGVRLLGSGSVVIWLFPLLERRVVDHHPGPFDGLRLMYDCEHHTTSRADHYIGIVNALSNSVPNTNMIWVENGETIRKNVNRLVLQNRIERKCR